MPPDPTSGHLPRCELAPFSPRPCDGRLIRAHLIPQQLLRREFPKQWKALARDERSWVWACGGITGVGGHHGELDYSRTLRIPRASLPDDTEEFAQGLGLGWWLDRTYGPLD